MVRLVRYELKKCLWKKPVLLLLLALTLVNLGAVYGAYRDQSPFDQFPRWRAVYPAIYQQLQGEITLEKIDWLLSVYRPIEAQVADRTASTATDNPDTYTGNVYSDYYFFNQNFVAPMAYLYTYRAQARAVADAALANLPLYDAVGNGYEYRKNQVIAALYERRAIPDFAFTGGYNALVHYDFSILPVLLLTLYVLSGVFVPEKERGMDQMLLTVERGGRPTTAAKLIASALATIGVSAWFWLTDFLGFAVCFGALEGGALPVYALENFAQAAVGMPLLQYALLSSAVKTLGAVAVGLLFLLISQFFRSALFPHVLGLLAMFALAWLHGAYGASSHMLKLCNPFALLQCRAVFRTTEFVNIFGVPALSYQVALLWGGVWCALLALAVAACTGKNAVEKGGGCPWRSLCGRRAS